jgi:imidazolonepropionase-like amidohydrolase
VKRRGRLLIYLLASQLALTTAPALQAATTAIVHGKVYPVSGPAIDDGTVLIENGRIRAVGSSAEIKAPAGATVYDAGGKVVTPGLIDAGTQIGLVEVELTKQTVDSALDIDDPIRAAFRVTDGFNPFSTLIPITRIEGVTTVLSRPDGGVISGQAALVDLYGRSLYDMLIKAPAAMMAHFGVGDAKSGGSRGGVALALRRALEDAHFYATHRSDYNSNQSRSMSVSRLDLEALQPVLSGSLPLLVEANRSSDIEAVLAVAREFGVNVVLYGAAEAWLVADELAAAQVRVLVGPLSDLPASFSVLHATFANAARLDKAGVEVGIVSGSSHNSRNLTVEAGRAVAAGLPWDKALAAITQVPARALGIVSDYGSLAPGKVADVVVWSSDPLDFAGHPDAVWIRGHRVPMTSRQELLFKRYETLDGTPPEYKN